jgi:glycosyltransferase involved in cell wall biosynthesis
LKIILFANTDWYIYNFRLSLARTLQDAGHDVLLISPPGTYAEKLQELGFRWLPIPMQRRSLNPIREIALVIWLYRLLRHEKIDLLHGFTIKAAVYGSIAARMANVPAIVVGIDGLGYVYTSEDLKAKVLRPLVSSLLKFALLGKNTRLILLNQDDEKLFKKNSLAEPNKIRLIRGAGVDCNRFSVGGERVCDKPIRILMASRLLSDKGLIEYVEAAKLIKFQNRNIQFLLAGKPDPGNPKSVPEEIVLRWVNDGLIKWLGHVPDMAALLSTVHIVALPSYREGLPTTLIEAAACSIPLITTDVPGCREVVIHEVDGLLVPVRDSLALAQAIIRLVDDPVLAARLGSAARAKVMSIFNEQIVIQSTIDVYAELMI